MVKKIIGIPRAFNYYRDYILWKNFFEMLDFDIMVSNNTTIMTVQEGEKYLIDESCLSLKIYMSHVHELVGKRDFILVPRLNCIKKNEKVCTNFMAIYDLCKNTFNSVDFLNYNVDLTKKQSEKSHL